jgi:Bacterial transcriptional activator domain/Berberine and berberine like/AAA ATPase domain
VAEHPFRERLQAQHMLALYRLARRAAALESYRRARGALVEELGLEPGPELRELERAILVDDPALLADGLPRARVVAPEHLPPDVADFTGREPALAELRSLLCADRPHGAPVIVSVSGKPGVGKSALAVHAAHRLRPAFPDGQLYVSLRGTEADRVEPGAVLEEWLRALGAARDEIPGELAARARAYRARLSPAPLRPWLHDVRAAVRSCSLGAGYVSFLGEEGGERVRAAYGSEIYQRLAAVKRAVDPSNRFRFNQNIPPASH